MASSVPFGSGFHLPLNACGHSRNLGTNRRRASHSHRPQSASGAAGASAPEGLLGKFPVKASLTAGGLALTGDTIAQTLGKYHKHKKSLKPGEDDDVLSWLLVPHDFVRSLRMLTYGALLYGPGSDWWYKLLDARLPEKTLSNFVAKIVLNQIVLGPAVVAVVFAWNYLWAGRIKDLPAKYKSDFFSTMVDGWKFWVPAATVNFGVVPLQARVGFMSVCAIFWNFYLSSRMMK
ncbi:hypothetical protein KFL_006020030 [Klebsormidium nitens]|uniref:Uncharacterized protein n=1 Tax=Klebsormidium nitens TaxID=105231 RepID=A0A1Y1IGV8_KLENI|nr:hypothetical protein KFL_006020030 [Klebsormidium nitens]|eukprot:GAQ90114.1 hypothetical protein KFL_006020030 [Klebsormidium nitens]